ncbi:MAG: NADH-quinone oxidoreductase subunit C [Ilumatobacteraceae bacterium]|nr:NADH-quinone oxidoreductase subunit C [Ilumatobacteraceae bacterium]
MSLTTDTPAATDVVRDGILARVQAALGDKIVESLVKPGDDIWVRVRTESWRETAVILRDLGFSYFDFLSAIDWLPSPFGRGEDDPTEPAPVRDTTIRRGYTGGDTRIQMLARVVDPTTSMGINLKTDVPDDNAHVESWTTVYAGANWHEREAWEMFGITFDGHPDLRHIYLPTDFEGFPLRKDFPLLARIVKPWPGIVDVEPMPGGDQDEPAQDGDAQ